MSSSEGRKLSTTWKSR